MSTLSYAVADSATMLRRQLRHMRRYLSVTLQLIGMPVVFLLLFVYVFGGTLGAGLGGPGGGRAEYVAYVTPGILLMAVALGAAGTAISVAMDMTEGIMARFRTMAIFRPSVLAAGLLDELHLLMHPIAVRKGMRLFDEGEPPIPLTLVSSQTFRTGVLNLVYAPAESAGDVTYEDAKLHLPQPEQ